MWCQTDSSWVLHSSNILQRLLWVSLSSTWKELLKNPQPWNPSSFVCTWIWLHQDAFPEDAGKIKHKLLWFRQTVFGAAGSVSACLTMLFYPTGGKSTSFIYLCQWVIVASLSVVILVHSGRNEADRQGYWTFTLGFASQAVYRLPYLIGKHCWAVPADTTQGRKRHWQFIFVFRTNIVLKRLQLNISQGQDSKTQRSL